jgi:dipeptidyl aminopeptidase/acylaminoacyl peptidase
VIRVERPGVGARGSELRQFSVRQPRESRSTSRCPVGVALLLLLPLSAAQAPQPERRTPIAAPPTEVFVAQLIKGPPPLAGMPASYAVGAPTNASNNRDYDNQPFFTPDGRTILFTSKRDGRQTDIYQYDLATKSLMQLTSTPESEYSPTITPAGNAFSVIRVEVDGTQRLWQFPLAKGGTPTLLRPDLKPVGYHAWIDASRLAVFVLGTPATLRFVDLESGSAGVVADTIGRCLQHVPGRGSMSFVQKGKEKEPWTISEIDPETRKITAITETLPGREDYAWTPDGALLMADGSRLFMWTRESPKWRQIADLAPAGLKSITRLAVSPDGHQLALVAEQ